MTYKATGTKNSSGQDVQEPSSLPESANTIAIAPAAEAEVARASYVIINVEHATKYEFKYTSGGSYVDYGIVAADGPVRIDINPIAWKGGAGTTGHVSFIYNGKNS
tara:strand:- start:1236 stop:1553 length:318 start_codon:yes stop_codon:yes gene_type:complete